MGFNKKFFTTGGIVASSPAAAFDPLQNFETVTYTGNGSTQSITSLDFQPDLVWIKDRGVSGANHVLSDSVRGTGKFLISNSTDSEYTSAGGTLSSFDSNGFTLAAPPPAYDFNINGNSYVAWCLKGGGTAVSNTDGSITSTVSANQDAGFSIVKWTGDGSSSANVGHGLSSTPELVISKSTSEANNWWTGVKDVDGVLQLDSTSAVISSGGTNGAIGKQSTYTSTVFGFLAGSASVDNANKSGQNYIAYCFHSVDGYQKIGSYTGNGTSNSITGIGFQPRFVLIKRTDSANGWNLFDSVRGAGLVLFPHTSGAELDNTANFISFDSDGFSLASSGGDTNASGGTYIYLAIA